MDIFDDMGVSKLSPSFFLKKWTTPLKPFILYMKITCLYIQILFGPTLHGVVNLLF